jgi:hypothetical protein
MLGEKDVTTGIAVQSPFIINYSADLGGLAV